MVIKFRTHTNSQTPHLLLFPGKKLAKYHHRRRVFRWMADLQQQQLLLLIIMRFAYHTTSSFSSAFNHHRLVMPLNRSTSSKTDGQTDRQKFLTTKREGAKCRKRVKTANWTSAHPKVAPFYYYYAWVGLGIIKKVLLLLLLLVAASQIGPGNLSSFFLLHSEYKKCCCCTTPYTSHKFSQTDWNEYFLLAYA